MKQIFIVLIFIFLISNFAFSGVQINPNVLLENGIKAAENENYQKAISTINKAIENGLSGKDKLEKAYSYLSKSYFQIENIEKAIENRIKLYDIIKYPKKYGAIVLLCDVKTEDVAEPTGIEYKVFHGKSVGSGRWNADRNKESKRLLKTTPIFVYEEGNVKVQFLKFGYQSKNIDVYIPKGEIIKVKNSVVLSKSKIPIEYIKVEGKIEEIKTSTPIYNIKLNFRMKDSTYVFDTATNEEGIFGPNEIPKGNYYISFNSPYFYLNGIHLNLYSPKIPFPKIQMYRTKKVMVEYVIADNMNLNSLNHRVPEEVVLKTTGMPAEPGSGFNFITKIICGDGYGPNSNPMFYIRQEKDMVKLYSGIEAKIAKMKKNSIESVKRIERQNFIETRHKPFIVKKGDIFSFKIQDGKYYAIAKILKIEDRLN